MNYLDSTKLIVSTLLGLLGLAITLGFLFLFWGVFNGFDWDLPLFLSKVGGGAAAIAVAGYFFYLFVNRNKDEQKDS